MPKKRKQRPKMHQKKCILIFGMHRSGTSALAGSLCHLGVDLGDNLMEANAFNEKGYFEDKDVYRLNDKIIASSGFYWDGIRTEEIRPNKSIKREIQELFLRKFINSRICIIKDPRISLMFSLWKEALEELGVQCFAIVMYRNPIEVAESLLRRGKTSKLKSFLLWAKYSLLAESSTRELSDRLFVSFDALLNNPTACIQGVIKVVDPAFKFLQKNLAKTTDFLDAELKHHQASPKNKRPEELPWIVDLYQALKKEQNNPDIFDDFNLKLNDTLKLFYSNDVVTTLMQEGEGMKLLHTQKEDQSILRIEKLLHTQKEDQSILRIEKLLHTQKENQSILRIEKLLHTQKENQSILRIEKLLHTQKENQSILRIEKLLHTQKENQFLLKIKKIEANLKNQTQLTSSLKIEIKKLNFYKKLFNKTPKVVYARWIRGFLRLLNRVIPAKTPIPKSYLIDKRVFDPDYYMERNWKGENIFNNDKEKATKHWIKKGVFEGLPSARTFRVKFYLRNNLELKSRFKKDYTAAIQHWLEEGMGNNLLSSPQGKIQKDKIKEAIKTAREEVRKRNWALALTQWEFIIELTKNESLLGRANVNVSILNRLKSIDTYKSIISNYNKSRKHEGKKKGLKIAVYTALINNYDTIKLPEVLDEEVTYVLFSDSPIEDTGVWQIRPVPYSNTNKTRIARFVKTHPHTLLTDFDLVVWVDSNILLLDSIIPFITDLVKSGKSVAAIPHPQRENIYEEAEKCVELGKDEGIIIQNQIEHYQKVGFIHQDLIESNFMILDLRNNDTQEFLNTWWTEIDNHSQRDQLSLNYSLNKHGISWHRLVEHPTSVRNHPSFAYGSHEKHDDGMSHLLTSELKSPLKDPFSKEEISNLETDKSKDWNGLDLRGKSLIQFTPEKTGNAYYTEIPSELGKRGWDVTCSTDWDAAYDALKERPTLVLFHQLEPFYHKNNLEDTRKAAHEFIKKINKLTHLGGKLALVWHNPLPHNRDYIEIDIWLYNSILSLFGIVIVHLRSSIPYVARFFDRSKIAYLPHPSFYGIYEGKMSRDEARKKLGINRDAFLFLSLGGIKPYKGHDILIETWKNFKQKKGTNKAVLCIAGRLHDKSLQDFFTDLPDTIIRLEYIPDEEIEMYLGAADISIYNHKEIWTSGAAIMSMSSGVPVIMPRSIHTEQYVKDLDNGFLYSPDSIEDLEKVMNSAMNSPLLNHMKYINKKRASINTFEKGAKELSQLLNQK